MPFEAGCPVITVDSASVDLGDVLRILARETIAQMYESSQSEEHTGS